MGDWKQHKQLMKTTFRGVRANLPADRIATRLGREGRSCFYSCSGCFSICLSIVDIVRIYGAWIDNISAKRRSYIGKLFAIDRRVAVLLMGFGERMV